jgi:hypothetical protein
MLTYALVIVAVLVVIFVIVASRQPDTFRVQRSTLVHAPASAPFDDVNDFRNWEKWSPYMELDPNMTTTYAGPHSGVGAEMAWSGNSKAGQGRMTIVESRQDELIRIRLEFTKPFAAINTAEFTFSNGGGGTAVTWAMSGKNTFMFKAMHTVMNMDKLVGRDFDRGLAKLKNVVEADSN